MLSLNDPKWKYYKDAMGSRFDASRMLRQLLDSGPSKEIWDLYWNHLVYQDDIGDVSYACVPYLANFIKFSSQIDWNALALISAIELARPTGPEVPPEVEQDYYQTIESMPLLLAQHPQIFWDDLTTRCAVSCVAISRGQRELARLYAEMSIDEGIEWLKSQGE